MAFITYRPVELEELEEWGESAEEEVDDLYPGLKGTWRGGGVWSELGSVMEPVWEGE